VTLDRDEKFFKKIRKSLRVMRARCRWEDNINIFLAITVVIQRPFLWSYTKVHHKAFFLNVQIKMQNFLLHMRK
jgi:hypothetical protein